MTRDGLKRVTRTFLIAFLGLFLPGLFGWLNALTEWARAEGQQPFPDARSLAFLGVAAIVAGVIALLNFVVIWLEDATGHGLLRTPPPTGNRTDRGATTPQTAFAALVVLGGFSALFIVAVLARQT